MLTLLCGFNLRHVKIASGLTEILELSCPLFQRAHVLMLAPVVTPHKMWSHFQASNMSTNVLVPWCLSSRLMWALQICHSKHMVEDISHNFLLHDGLSLHNGCTPALMVPWWRLAWLWTFYTCFSWFWPMDDGLWFCTHDENTPMFQLSILII